MKRFIALISVLPILLSLCACVPKAYSENNNPTENTTQGKYIEKLPEPTAVAETTSDSEENNDNNDRTDKNIPLVIPEIFQKWSSIDSSDPQIRKITDDTPDHAGVNLREKPDSASQLILVIPEGTDVYWLNDLEDSNTYVQIAVKADGKTYIGYVMQRYVTTFTGAAFDYIVCYNTPGDAGIVLREERTRDSKALLTVPEGTQVRVWEHNTETEEYWSVDVFIGGEVLGGYVLGRYLEYVG